MCIRDRPHPAGDAADVRYGGHHRKRRAAAGQQHGGADPVGGGGGIPLHLSLIHILIAAVF